jgi:5-methylthioadenosine/S-adenosylhomocysteine deaminase
MSDRLLLRGGYVLSMDDEIGELPVGDVLIEDGAIAVVAERVEARTLRSWTSPGTR